MVDRSRAGWIRQLEDGVTGLGGPRRRLSVVAVVAALVVLVALIAFVILGNSDHHARRPGSPAPGTASTGPSGAVSGASNTSTPQGAPLTVAPAGVVWQLVDGAALPTSRLDGPAHVAGGVPGGFAHTPAGALLACVQIGFRLGSVNPAEQAAVVRASVIGAGQASLLASRPAATPAVKPQVAGFQYLTYTPAQAVIGFAWRVTDVASSTTQFVGVGDLQVAWVSGDWRLVDDGTPTAQPTVLDPQLPGYVAFAGA